LLKLLQRYIFFQYAAP